MGLQVSLQNISKKYSNHFVIKDYSCEFQSNGSYAILGSNGSGKSTFIKMLSGLHSPSRGQVVYQLNNQRIPVEHIYSHVSLAAPWSDVIEDLTLEECIKFHFTFRKPVSGIQQQDVISISGLEGAKKKLIHQFSSGMKQRVRLVLAFTTQSDLLLLDEPTSNLDADGKDWYQNLVQQYVFTRTVIVASNHIREEYDFCNHIIDLNKAEQ